MNLDPLQEQQVFLAAELSLQIQYICFSRVPWAILGWQEVGRRLSLGTGSGCPGFRVMVDSSELFSAVPSRGDHRGLE